MTTILRFRPGPAPFAAGVLRRWAAVASAVFLGGAAMADAELDAAAEALAEAGRTATTPAASGAAARPSPSARQEAQDPAAASGTPAAAAEPPLQGVFAGKAENAGGEVRGRFTADGKVEWVEPGKRSYNAPKTNACTFTLSRGKITIVRPEGDPLVYRLADDRKSLEWESGDSRALARRLQTAPQ